MSSQKGNVARTRPQKYKNRTAFKNDLHDKTPQQKRCNAMHVSEVCLHCKSVIEWKIKYKKYKPLTQPKTCARCQQRNVVKAYYVLCRDCSRKDRVCSKCLRSCDEVEIEPPKPTALEEQKLKVEMDRLIKSFPERKRRAFIRYMNRGKPLEEEGEDGVEDKEIRVKEGEQNESDESDCEDDEEKETVKIKRIPYTREELLKKIEELTLADGDDESDSDDENSEDDNCNINGSEDETDVKNIPKSNS